MAARVGLVDIVRDFIVVHQRFQLLFQAFRDGSLEFETVRHLVADSDKSVLFRLKERVHRKFRKRDLDLALRRGEVLFDLAVGSLFHEALKFRENLYQLKVYGPQIRDLRDGGAEDIDGLLAEFEKLLRASADRLGESLRETETLLEQTRKQLPALLLDFADDGTPEAETEVGLVARFLLDERAAVEEVYAEGVEHLLERVYGNLQQAYAAAVRSHLASAHFDKALSVVAEARERAGALPDEFDVLASYADGMQAFLDGDYARCVERLGAWNAAPGRAGVDPELAGAALGRLPQLVGREGPAELVREGRALAAALAG